MKLDRKFLGMMVIALGATFSTAALAARGVLVKRGGTGGGVAVAGPNGVAAGGHAATTNAEGCRVGATGAAARTQTGAAAGGGTTTYCPDQGT
jgi:hypothetical protein